METKECQICYNQIPIKAKKCHYCFEWQEKIEENFKEEITKYNVPNFNNKFPLAKKPFQLLVVQKIPLHYTVSILIISILIFAAIQISWYKLNEEQIYLLSFLAFTIQMIISWAGIIWIYGIINENYYSTIQISSNKVEVAEKNFKNAHNKIFNNIYGILFGFIVGLIASIGDYIVGTPFKTQEAKLIFAGFEFLNMFFAGAAIYSMIMFAVFLNDISIKYNSDFLSLEKNLAINNIGRIHLKTSILAIVPLFLGVIAKFIGNWNWDILIIVWYVSFAFLIILYIYWPVQNIHKLMQVNVESQITIIQNKIHKLLNEINYNPSSRNFTKLKELRALEDSISSQNTWPFDTKSISAAFFAIIFPIILIIVDKIWAL